jgi:iron complex outermembrane receptor protein
MKTLLRQSAAASILACMLLASPSQAQDQQDADANDDDFHRTGEIVVTAPYFERLDLLAGTSALSGEDLAQQSRGQIGDTLLSLPGVSATSFTPGSSRPVLRGFQGNRVAVLTDGIGNIDASNTSADHAVTIESLTTERIEVLRGPAVLLFGGQAVGGAVNAIDKRIPRAVPEEFAHVDALAGYGSAADEWSGGASVDVPVAQRFVVHADGSYRKSSDLRIGGFQLSPDLRTEVLELADAEQLEGNGDEAAALRDAASHKGRVPNSGVETWTTGLGTAFIDDGGNLGVSVSLYDTSYGIPRRPGTGHHPADIVGEGQQVALAESGEEAVTIGLRQYRADLRGEVETGGGFLEKLTFRAGYADYQHTEFEGDAIGTVFKSQGFEGRIEAAIGPDRHHPKRISTQTLQPKPAVTDYRVEELFDKVAARLLLSPQTGRTHQIRAHLHVIGHPILGDRSYGGERVGAIAGYEIPRVMLHARTLGFRHPATGLYGEWTADIPPDFQAVRQGLYAGRPFAPVGDERLEREA